MIQKQQSMVFSPYMALYDLIVPQDNMLRQMNELVDFSFVYDELKDKYCHDNRRNAIDPIQMFKYLLLKVIYDLSDVDVVERSKYDMSFKYFLGMAPEDSVIEPSSLTKFRKLRLKDMNLLDLLIEKSVVVAIEKGIIKSKCIIVDATHTKARYNQMSPREALMNQSKKVRKAVYQIQEERKECFPAKNTADRLEDELRYCETLIEVIEKNPSISEYPKVKEPLNLLKEMVEGDQEKLKLSKDEDAKIGHKSADTSFFGYKTHLAMNRNALSPRPLSTTGEKNDGKELQTLIEKSKAAGMEIETVIGADTGMMWHHPRV